MFGPVSPENERYYATCKQLITELGLSGAAILEGPIPRQVDAFQAGHLVALTSVSEGFPFTVVKSMSMGRPQVCTNVGGVPEAVGKDAGFVVPPRDHEAVAAACIQLLTDAGLRHAFGARARQRVLERFNLDHWTNAYRDMCTELVPAVPAGEGGAPAGDRRRSARRPPDTPASRRPFDSGETTSATAPYSHVARRLAEATLIPGPDAAAPEPGEDQAWLPLDAP